MNNVKTISLINFESFILCIRPLVNKSLMEPLIVEKVREERPRMLGVHQEMAVEKKLYQNEL